MMLTLKTIVLLSTATLLLPHSSTPGSVKITLTSDRSTVAPQTGKKNNNNMWEINFPTMVASHQDKQRVDKTQMDKTLGKASELSVVVSVMKTV